MTKRLCPFDEEMPLKRIHNNNEFNSDSIDSIQGDVKGSLLQMMALQASRASNKPTSAPIISNQTRQQVKNGIQCPDCKELQPKLSNVTCTFCSLSLCFQCRKRECIICAGVFCSKCCVTVYNTTDCKYACLDCYKYSS